MREYKNAKIRDKLKSNLKWIGYQITQYRKRNHKTETQLAEEANLPQSSIARIEHGKNTSTATLAKIALAMNRNISLKNSHNLKVTKKVMTKDIFNE